MRPVSKDYTNPILRLPAAEEPENGDLRLTVRQALTWIPPEQREAIEMAFFSGLTCEETAGRLALPLGTLKSRLRLGLRTMRARLQPAVVPL